MCTSVLPAYMSVNHVFVWCSKKAEEIPLNIGVIYSCEPLYRCWKLNLGPLEEQLANHGAISPTL